MNSAAPPFVLVDGSYYLFRAFHALPPLATSKGLHTNAVKGAITAIQKLMRRTQPTHMAVVFDTPEPTFRHELSADYKANRPSMPSELSDQIPYLHALISALGIPLLALPGAEADDLMGTLAQRAVEEGHRVLISTGDKDMCQLINDHIQLEDSFKEKVMDYDAVIEKFGVRPDQIVDYLTLMGDAVDGIMGIPRVGAKTAAKLLQEYDNIGNLLANAENIKGAVGQSIRDHAHQIPLNHQLASIVCNLPLELDWHELKLSEQNVPELKRLYTELEFKGALQSLEHPNHPNSPYNPDSDTRKKEAPINTGGTSVPYEAPDNKKVDLHPVEYETVITTAQFEQLLDRLKTAPHWVFDTETTALDWRQAQVVGLAFAFEPYKAYYVPLAHDYAGAPEQLSRDEVLNTLKPLFENPEIKKIGQHLKYDAHVLRNHGIQLAGWYFDTMLASYTLNPTGSRHNLDDLAKLHLGHTNITFEDIAGKGVKQLTFNQIPVEIAAPYAAEDADITYRLFEHFKPQLEGAPELAKLFYEVEMPVATVLEDMESLGIALDTQFLDELGERFGKDMDALEKQAHTEAGKEFNVASPKQLGEVLFDHLALKGGKKTASGQYGTSESILENIDHPLAQTVLDYRSLAKLKSTYTDRLVEQSDPDTKRVHTSYHQAVTATGRLSSTDPNLQNIPIRGETGRLIRQAFVAPKGKVLLAADYSQIELRLMAHFSGDEALIKAFEEGKDIHQATAAEILGIDLDNVTGDQRRQAKAINFGLLYGMSAFGLAKQLKLSREEAQNYIGLYFSRYPGVLEYMEKTRHLAGEQGYVTTLLGRRLYTPDIHARAPMMRQAAERAAINAPLQGSAADIIKLAMIDVHKMLAPTSAKMLLQVHDELVYEVNEKEADELTPKIAEAMSKVVEISVPLLVEVGKGSNWESAH